MGWSVEALRGISLRVYSRAVRTGGGATVCIGTIHASTNLLQGPRRDARDAWSVAAAAAARKAAPPPRHRRRDGCPACSSAGGRHLRQLLPYAPGAARHAAHARPQTACTRPATARTQPAAPRTQLQPHACAPEALRVQARCSRRGAVSRSARSSTATRTRRLRGLRRLRRPMARRRSTHWPTCTIYGRPTSLSSSRCSRCTTSASWARCAAGCASRSGETRSKEGAL